MNNNYRLAEEEALLFLQHLDIVDRQVSDGKTNAGKTVCRQWLFILKSIAGIQHIRVKKYCDTSCMFSTGHVVNNTVPSTIYSNTSQLVTKEFIGPRPVSNYCRPKSEWHFHTTDIHTLIIDFGFGSLPDINIYQQNKMRIFMRCLVERLSPSLKTIFIINYVELCPAALRDGEHGINQDITIHFPIGLLVSVLPVCHHPKFPLNLSQRPIPSFEGLTTWFIEVPQMALNSSTECVVSRHRCAMDKKLWPYGNDADVWLAKTAAILNQSSELLYLIKNLMMVSNQIIVCKEHGVFCDHLGPSHFNAIEGHYRRLLSVCILKFAKGSLCPPPYDFMDKIVVLAEGILQPLQF